MRNHRTQPQRQSVATIIRARRLAAGLSQQGLADRMTAAGVPTGRAEVSRWEKGVVDPAASRFVAVFEVTDVSSADPVVDQLTATVARMTAQMAALRQQLAQGEE